MAYSPAPANTPRVRTAAATSPVTSDPAMIRRMGPVRGWRPVWDGSPGAGDRWVERVVIAMTGRLPERWGGAGVEPVGDAGCSPRWIHRDRVGGGHQAAWENSGSSA